MLSPSTPEVADGSTALSKWPELVGLEELLFDDGQLPMRETNAPYPAELQHIPEDITSEVLARIVKQSLIETPPKLLAVGDDSPEVLQAPLTPTTSISNNTDEHSISNSHTDLPPLRTQIGLSASRSPTSPSDGSFSPRSNENGSLAGMVNRLNMQKEAAKEITSRHKEQFSRRCNCGAIGGKCSCASIDQRSMQVETGTLKETGRTADELAAVVAEIERIERQDAGERLRQQEAERLHEEEEQRQQEEKRRREERDARERERERVMVIADEMRDLWAGLARINQLQQNMLIARHQIRAEQIHKTAAIKQTEFDATRSKLEAAFAANLQYRKNALDTIQSTKMLELITVHEEDENATLVSIQRLLRGKSNREEREKDILDRLNNNHQQERAELEKAHKTIANELQYHGTLESAALQAGIAKKLRDVESDTNSMRYEFSSVIISDRRWFVSVLQRRRRLLEQHRMNLLKSPATNPVGQDTTTTTTTVRPPPNASPNSLPAELSADRQGSHSSRGSIFSYKSSKSPSKRTSFTGFMKF
ncbi:hypothetical protein FQN57_006607 [Myotisia sp. PD_48]|nr:hypothetical protein FQN57_006607 [Myotisia sp. PD_48]